LPEDFSLTLLAATAAAERALGIQRVFGTDRTIALGYRRRG
jgi:hypothetical protein